MISLAKTDSSEFRSSLKAGGSHENVLMTDKSMRQTRQRWDVVDIQSSAGEQDKFKTMVESVDM